MKPVARSVFDETVLLQRSLRETVIDELKNLCQIEHTRHRSPINFSVNLMAGQIAYCLASNKPRLPVETTRAVCFQPVPKPN
jgi:hypothetical protein